MGYEEMGYEEMGSSADVKFTRFGVQEILRSGVEEMGSS